MPAPRVPPFVPQPLLANAHLQTVARAFPSRRAQREATADEARTIRVDEETRIVVRCRWHGGAPDAAAVVLVHGLTGDADSAYLLGTAAKAYAAGFHAIRTNLRNCGGTEHLTPTLYHAGLVEDVEAVVRDLRDAGVTRVHLAGFSLGGNLVLRLAGMEGGARLPSCVRSVAAVSPAIDLAACCARIDAAPGTRFYRARFVRDLSRRIRRKAALFPDRYDLRGLEALRTVRGIDERYTAPGFGFEGADDYYARCSALPVLPSIRVPTLLIHARDDVLVPFDAFELPEVREAPRVTLLAPHRGGHCGFVARRPESPTNRRPDEGPGDRHWAEHRVVEFFAREDHGGLVRSDSRRWTRPGRAP